MNIIDGSPFDHIANFLDSSRAGCDRCNAPAAHDGVRTTLGRVEPWHLCAACFCKPATDYSSLPRPTHRYCWHDATTWRCARCGKTKTRDGAAT